MPVKHRNDVVLNYANSVFGPKAGVTVNVYPPGAIVSGTPTGTSIPVYAGHGFIAGQKLIKSDGTAFSGANTVSSVTATTVVMDAGTYSFADGDILINLGVDGGTTTPNWTASPIAIYSTPDTADTISQAAVTTNSTGEYSYYHLLSNAWEVIRSGNTVLDVVRGVAPQAGEYNVMDYGAHGDGSNDDTKAIAAAALAVPTTGGTLFFPSPSSFYSVTGGPTLDTYSNVIIRGEKSEVRVANLTADSKPTNYNSWPLLGQYSLLRLIDCTDIVVEGLKLNGNISNRTTSGGESYHSGILIAGCTRVRVSDCYITENPTDGVCIECSDQAGTLKCYDVIVENCTITKNRRNNISVVAVDRCSIVNNLIQDAGSINGTLPMYGIDVEPNSAGQTDTVSIVGNNISGSYGDYAISCGGHDTPRVTISGNVISADQYSTGEAAYGINCQNCPAALISDNKITGGDVLISGGIRLVGANASQIQGNVITGFAYGIYSPDGADAVLIANNVIHTNLDHGILLDKSTNAPKKVLISHNVLYDNNESANSGSAYPGWSIALKGLDANSFITVQGNVIYGTTSNKPFGIKTSDSSQEVFLFGNMIFSIANTTTAYAANIKNVGWNYFADASTALLKNPLGSGNFSTAQTLYIGGKTHSFGTSAPNSGTYAVGDVVYNTAGGSTFGWRCENAALIWSPVSQVFTCSADRGNQDATATSGTDAGIQIFSTTLTADRKLTLDKAPMYNGGSGGVLVGWRFRVIRTASGAFNLNVWNGATGLIKALPASSWGEFAWSDQTSAWILASYGAL